MARITKTIKKIAPMLLKSIIKYFSKYLKTNR